MYSRQILEVVDKDIAFAKATRGVEMTREEYVAEVKRGAQNCMPVLGCFCALLIQEAIADDEQRTRLRGTGRPAAAEVAPPGVEDVTAEELPPVADASEAV